MRFYLITSIVMILLLGAAAPTRATYTQQFALGNDSTFQGQVMVAMLQTSANVMTEAATVAGHVQRTNFAIRVIQNPTIWNPIIAILLASQANNPMTPLTVPSTVSDTLVQTAMDAQWSNIAGYFRQ